MKGVLFVTVSYGNKLPPVPKSHREALPFPCSTVLQLHRHCVALLGQERESMAHPE